MEQVCYVLSLNPSVEPFRIVNSIKAIRCLCDLGLKEAKTLIDLVRYREVTEYKVAKSWHQSFDFDPSEQIDKLIAAGINVEVRSEVPDTAHISTNVEQAVRAALVEASTAHDMAVHKRLQEVLDFISDRKVASVNDSL